MVTDSTWIRIGKLLYFHCKVCQYDTMEGSYMPAECCLAEAKRLNDVKKPPLVLDQYKLNFRKV